MLVSLFTSRIVLQTLGVTDYGINNVVGGVVAMFGFISGALMSITQRFISVELGKGGDNAVLQKIFSTSMILHVCGGIIIVIIAETAGLWFLNNKLVIPAERIIAANWVYQFAIFGFFLSLLNAPLMALIISHEDIYVYGYMGIFDVVVRLITVYLLVIVSADKLIFFALLGFAVSCIVWLFYFIYCRKKYREARFSFVYDNSLIKELSVFGGWTFCGNFFFFLRIQGINILLNMFYGPAINAARGIAFAVNTALMSFGNNFAQAINPQLVKLYSAKDVQLMWDLVERGARMTYFLFFVFSVPILLKTDFILQLWLGNVPEYAGILTKLMIIEILVTSLSNTSKVIINATGKLVGISCISLVNSVIVLAFSYFLCKEGYAPYYALILPIITMLPVTVAIFALLKKLVNFSVRFFTKKALIPIFFVSSISFLPFYFGDKLLSESFLNSCVIIILSMFWTGFVIMFVGLRKNERVKLIVFIKRKVWDMMGKN